MLSEQMELTASEMHMVRLLVLGLVLFIVFATLIHFPIFSLSYEWLRQKNT